MHPVSSVFAHIMWLRITYRPSFSFILTFIHLLLINATVRSNIDNFVAFWNISSKLAFLLDKITVSQRENWQSLDKDFKWVNIFIFEFAGEIISTVGKGWNSLNTTAMGHFSFSFFL